MTIECPETPWELAQAITVVVRDYVNREPLGLSPSMALGIQGAIGCVERQFAATTNGRLTPFPDTPIMADLEDYDG